MIISGQTEFDSLEYAFLKRSASLPEPCRVAAGDKEGLYERWRNLLNQPTIPGKLVSSRMLQQMQANVTAFREIHDLLAGAAARRYVMLPAADWLLDNFYLIDAQLRYCKGSLTKELLAKLPCSEHADGRISPRIFDLLHDIVACYDGQVSQEIVAEIVDHCQSGSFLQISELRSIPLLLVMVLLENVKKISTRIVTATILANRVDGTVAGRASDEPDMGMEQTREKILLRNNIVSLRTAGLPTWRQLIHTISFVDKVLSDDPAGVYAAMDFHSREMYCSVVEQLAGLIDLPEHRIAAYAVTLAQASPVAVSGADHVGYYLMGPGLQLLKERVGIRDTMLQYCRRAAGRWKTWWFVAAVCFLTLLCTELLLLPVYGNLPAWLLVSVTGCLLIFTSQLAVTLVNWVLSISIRPSLMPRLDYSLGIPPESRTLVIVPAMLTSEAGVENLVMALEVRYLAAKDAYLHFGLLTDFGDAPFEVMEKDTGLLELARTKIAALNNKYGRPANDTFFFFHRPRQWNPGEGVWMGYERKRGKLAQLNELLQTGNEAAFSCVVGDRSLFDRIKYIITLDTDTQLPRNAAWKMIATMAHPLNRPVYDARKDRIVRGYGILQPRIGAYMPEYNRSIYVRMQGGRVNIDPYTRATSDVYQDVFGEGSFIGKGIYDVSTFDRVLRSKFRENRILSHDLIEGCFVRSGLVSDVQLFEERPFGYYPDTKRHHRWIRGDWQIASFLLPYIKLPAGGRVRNGLSGLSRWKIFDNLRRSLVPTACMALLSLTWTVLAYPLYWTLVVCGIIMFPCFISIVHNFIVTPRKILGWQHWRDAGKSILDSFTQSLFAIICIPYEVFYTLDAILRTCWRMAISKKHLLEWSHSGSAVHNQVRSLMQTYAVMWICPLAGLSGCLYMTYFQPLYWQIGFLLFVSWVVSPAITWFISLPAKEQPVTIGEEDTIYLRKLARKTWRFFEEFVNEQEHWLPPDYYQEYPINRVSHRTSPTNIGLSQLANLAAFDFGYCTAGEMMQRTARTLQTLQSLDRYRGHFYNWYDTHTLKPVKPGYISTVDSGNLIGHLLVLRQGLLALPNEPVIREVLWAGLIDTFRLMKDEMPGETLLDPLQKELDNPITPSTPQAWKATIDLLLVLTAPLLAGAGSRGSVSDWVGKFDRQCRDILQELVCFFPWLFEADTAGHEAACLRTIPTLHQLESWGKMALPATDSNPTVPLSEIVRTAAAEAHRRIAHIQSLADQCFDLCNVEFDFLYNKQQELLSIGYNVEKQRRDSGCYDLLASEARLATYIAIAQGKLPQESWFALGRPLVYTRGAYATLSWSGSMFEYLMPLLVMPSFKDSLLDVTVQTIVQGQIRYGLEQNVPWGVSESAYNEVDINLCYQYGPSGVPGLGLQRGLGDSLVIAPYASMLGLLVAPQEASENLRRLSAMGAEGKYGFLEAVDFTARHLPTGKRYEIVKSCMSHHQGMGFLSLCSVLLQQPMQARFACDLQLSTGLMLLQEEPNRSTAFTVEPIPGNESQAENARLPDQQTVSPLTADFSEVIPRPVPQVRLLSNGKYHLLLTDSGAGYSRWNDLALTRWRGDRTCDDRGLFCFIGELDGDGHTSATYRPACIPAEQYQVDFSQGKAGFRLLRNGLLAETAVGIAQQDDLEIRRLTLSNQTANRKTVVVTSYAEVVLALPGDDAGHPAFNNLFMETEILAPLQAIICKRRIGAVQSQVLLFHALQIHGGAVSAISYETDRLRFLGRNRSLRNPQALTAVVGLSGSQGAVLDPIVSIQYQVELDPGATVVADLLLGVGESREACMNMVQHYRNRQQANSIFELSATFHQAVLKNVRISEAAAQLFNNLAGFVLFPSASWCGVPVSTSMQQPALETLAHYHLFDDLPVVVVRITAPEYTGCLEQVVKAHAYWRLYGLSTALVIFNEHTGNAHSLLHEYVAETIAAHSVEGPAAIRLYAAQQLPFEDRLLILSVARLVINADEGPLADQVARHLAMNNMQPISMPVEAPEVKGGRELRLPALTFFNGTGGFSQDGKEYLIRTAAGAVTPMPWVNVIANPSFGTVLSESGGAYTWAENAHEFRLTPWHNDPVSDPSGEAFYIRDEADGNYWSPAPMPVCSGADYITRHGFGYSVFEHEERGIYSQMKVYVDIREPVKFTTICMRNTDNATRQLTVTGYIEWVLDLLRARSAHHIHTVADRAYNAVLAQNPFHADLADTVGFFAVSHVMDSFTADRGEFIGRYGTTGFPQAMKLAALSNNAGEGADPCAAIRTTIELEANEECTITFLLGAGHDRADAVRLIRKFNTAATIQRAFEDVQHYWAKTLTTIQIATPDPSLNILANGWLIYQDIACRLWARSGYYQSGGAYGFRDQLQDVMAVMYTTPRLAREHILRCAARQFPAGDVLHWWQPPAGRGVRTRCADDFLWLPFVVSRYISITGDINILDERVSFLEGGLPGPGEESIYSLFTASGIATSLYDHCVRAIQHGMQKGDHGLPLMGSGDWNDAINKAGIGGKGESVWTGFFLHTVLTTFSDIASSYDDEAFAGFCINEAAQLSIRLEEEGWDGQWYRRGFFDNGTAMGSAASRECSIDSLCQSWAVLSGVAGQGRASMAMESAYKRLVSRQDAIIKIFDPPFNETEPNPGYIQGYLPGVRENGGQYTHAAIWYIMAWARLGNNQRVGELLKFINPILRALTPAAVDVYKVEPYVMAADIYTAKGHRGRGGWTWYTGSAGWMYQLILESVAGLTKEQDVLTFRPCMPDDWKSVSIKYQHGRSTYYLIIYNKTAPVREELFDDVEVAGNKIQLVDDGFEHFVSVYCKDPVLVAEPA